MKFSTDGTAYVTQSVAPLVGVWIEIVQDADSGTDTTVAPLVGVWIEIVVSRS